MSAAIDETLNDISTINNVQLNNETVSVVIKLTNNVNIFCPPTGNHNYKQLIDDWVADGNTIGTE